MFAVQWKKRLSTVVLDHSIRQLHCLSAPRRKGIHFLFGGEKSLEINRRKQAQYGDSCLSRSKIFERIERFKQEKTSLCDDESLGNPSTSSSEGIVIEGMASTQNTHKYHTFRKRKQNHCLSVHLDRTRSNHVERCATLQRLHGKTSDTLYENAADDLYLALDTSTVAKLWNEKLQKSLYLFTYPRITL
ncbi:hypothetical protein TNCV_70631 [Trichonephila clavipes]|nr:hypothetical protein TNCV_70631 [Trichonephila clavipes]